MAGYWFPILHEFHNESGFIYNKPFDTPQEAIDYAESVRQGKASANTARRQTAKELQRVMIRDWPEMVWSVIDPDEAHEPEGIDAIREFYIG